MIICFAGDHVPHLCGCGEEAAFILREAGFRDVRFLPFARYRNIKYFTF